MSNPLQPLSEYKEYARYEAIFQPENLDRLSASHQLLQRKRKLSALMLAHLCTFTQSTRCYPSLDEMRGELMRLWQVCLSRSSLFDRFCAPLVLFMRALFQQVLEVEIRRRFDLSLYKLFVDIVVLDSTVINLDEKCSNWFKGCGGGASGSSSKIQFNLGLLRGEIQQIGLKAGNESDSAYRIVDGITGVLYLFDLGYLCAENLKALISAGAYFLTRYKYDTRLWHPDGRTIHPKAIDRLVRRLKPGQFIDIPVLMGHKARIPLRWVLVKLPQEVGDQIRRKLKTDKQKKCKNLSEKRLAFCDVNAYITNLTPEQVPALWLRRLYAIRWQVEILFKTWKSGLNLDQVRQIGPYQFQACLYGGLIRMVIALKIFFHAKSCAWNEKQIELSEIKAFNLLNARKHDFAQWICFKQIHPDTLLREICAILIFACAKETRKKQHPPLKTLTSIP